MKKMTKRPKIFDELFMHCIDSPERTDFHPEGDLLSHFCIVLNRAASLNDNDLRMAAGIHDLFKPIIHGGEMKQAPNGSWYAFSPDHPKMAADWIEREDDIKHWCWSQGADWRVVKTICRFHMDMKQIDFMNRKTVWKLNREAVEMSGCGDIWTKLLLFRKCDNMLQPWECDKIIKIKSI